MKSGLSFLLGTVFGAVIGAIVALLVAPSSGEELRTNIKNQADVQYARLQNEWQKGVQEMQSRMDKMNSDLQALVNKSKETETPA